MDLRHVALIVWILCWVGMTAAYTASVVGGHLEPCVPHWSGCASISASGRYGAAYFIFKAVMIPAGTFFALYWWLCERWLRAAGDTPDFWRRTMLAVGVVGSAAFVLYATFLGSDADPLYRTLRRYGTIVFFGFTYIAQLLLVYRARALFGDTLLVRIKVIVCVFMLVEGLALEAFTYAIPDDAWLESLTEWHVAWALSFYPFLTWLLWRKSGVTFDVVHKP